jgi:hypothetical protein
MDLIIMTDEKDNSIDNLPPFLSSEQVFTYQQQVDRNFGVKLVASEIIHKYCSKCRRTTKCTPYYCTKITKKDKEEYM